jgi:transposase
LAFQIAIFKSMPKLKTEIRAWQQDRNKNKKTIKWQFTTADARIQLHKDGGHPVVGHHDTGSFKKTPLKPHLKDCWRIPPRERDSTKRYQRRSGGGRRPVEPRTALEGIFYVLRTGIPWNALSARFGSPSPVYRCFRRWCAASFFAALWKAGLEEYDEGNGMAWTWLSGDGCMTKAPLAEEAVGKNPTDRGKKRE